MGRLNNETIYVKWPTLIFCIISIAPIVFGQQARSTISGIVFGTQRAPVTQVPVEVLNDTNSVLQRTKTDSSGRFTFRSLYSGRFIVRVLPFGTNYEEQTQEVEIAGIGPDGRQLPDNIQLDFYLQTRRSSKDLVNGYGVVFVQEIPEAARNLYDNAIVDLDANRLEAGTTKLESAVEIFPTYYSALTRLGRIYVDRRKFDKARDVFKKAIEVNDRSMTGWYGLSYTDYSLNNPEGSIAAAQRALNLDRNSVETLFLVGLSYRRLKNYAEAEKFLVQAKKLDKGKTPEINWNLALLYAHNLVNYRSAADELELYLKFNSEDPNKEKIKKLIKQFRQDPPALK